MSDRTTYEDLEQKYNELLDKMITVKKECNRNIDAEKKKCENNIERINQRKRKNVKVLAIIMGICIIVLTFVIGTYFLPSFGKYQHEELTNGKDVVCYVTNTGDCYHKINCGHLRSVNKTTMYRAEMDGYSPCYFCWHYPRANYRITIKTNYFKKYGSVFAVLICISLILFCIFYKRKDRKIKIEIENEKTKLNDYKDLLLKQVLAKLGTESDFENKAKLYSGVPSDVDYRNNLPITKDDRFKVYMSSYGKCYHKKPLCRGSKLSYGLHIFLAMRNYAPCYFCASKIEIPIWHKKYMELNNLYKNIVNICK